MRKKEPTRTGAYRPLRSGGHDRPAQLDGERLYAPGIGPYCDPHLTFFEVMEGRCDVCPRLAAWHYTYRCLSHGNSHSLRLCVGHFDRLAAYLDTVTPR